MTLFCCAKSDSYATQLLMSANEVSNESMGVGRTPGQFVDRHAMSCTTQRMITTSPSKVCGSGSLAKVVNHSYVMCMTFN